MISINWLRNLSRWSTEFHICFYIPTFSSWSVVLQACFCHRPAPAFSFTDLVSSLQFHLAPQLVLHCYCPNILSSWYVAPLPANSWMPNFEDNKDPMGHYTVSTSVLHATSQPLHMLNTPDSWSEGAECNWRDDRAVGEICPKHINNV